MTAAIHSIGSREEYDAVRPAVQLARKGKLNPKSAVLAPGKTAGWYGYFVGGNWINERLIPHEDRPWRAFVESTPYDKNGNPDPEWAKGAEAFYANSHYLVFVRNIESLDPAVEDMKHLSMRTVENDARHDWREMQRVKNEVVGPDWEAAELYPSTSRVVDTANQYHLWCFPFQLPFGFNQGRFIMDSGNVESIGGSQRQLKEGDHPR